jgi:hypothetical protein
MKQTNADLDLKMRMQTLLWLLGYYTRIGVKLASYPPPKGKKDLVRSPLELTDVDVLGIKVDADLSFVRTLVDCTTRKTGSPIGRAFWLRGLMHFFHATRGYAVLARTIPPHERNIAAELGVILMDEEDVHLMEERYSISDYTVPPHIGNRKAHLYYEGNISTLSEKLMPLVEFRHRQFWLQKPGRALLNTIFLPQQLHQELDPSEKFHRALVVDLFTLFCLSVITMCEHLLTTAPRDLRSGVRMYLFGGVIGIQTRESLLSDLRALLESLPGQKPMFIREELTSRLQLDPPFLNELLERTVRLLNKPGKAKDILRYLQVALMEQVLYRGPSPKEVFGEEYSDVTLKFVKDLARFYEQAVDLDPNILKEIKEL